MRLVMTGINNKRRVNYTPLAVKHEIKKEISPKNKWRAS